MAGTPEHIPTPEGRKAIKEAAGMGLPLKYCARLVGLKHVETLTKHYQDDIDEGKAQKGIELVKTLHSKCIDDRCTTSLIFALKTQYGFKEGGDVSDDLVSLLTKMMDRMPN